MKGLAEVVLWRFPAGTINRKILVGFFFEFWHEDKLYSENMDKWIRVWRKSLKFDLCQFGV